MKLVVYNVSKEFKDLNAACNINLEFTSGIWGLLGANGTSFKRI
ncbi:MULTISPECIES: ABC transporter ATP-binding protein [Clostridium]|uniref:Uncharacterized protein n=1 Tax=Clostridium coskatii TaxID=1705578 RepID=A0A166UGW9_9CLOT|nr:MULTISPECIES: ABC transporter ATP-binding protein [Clostridium]ALU34712.1 ABC-type transporter ATP-binding protein [Clostridium autoethanogenum DSM 10061]OAA94907.1 hypothetical protein WX73_01315 [Clostridium coskatii]OBR91647.1 hypothetical protein CLCOS_32870 [Clostridium coskatii]OVY51431.1 hypothetical protein WX72_01564 [Clostridium autoethanogenum]